MNVAFVSLFDIRAIPLRILEGCLEEKGISSTTVFFKQHSWNGGMPLFSQKELETTGELILSANPDLIGVSLRSCFFHHAVELTAYLKQRADVPVIWGGTHAIISPESCVQHADIVCVGEGEKTIVQVCERLENNDSLAGVDNVCFWQGSELVRGDLGSLVVDLDELPVAGIGNRAGATKVYYDGKKVFHEDPLIVANTSSYVFLSGRGCPFTCAYCSNSFLRKHFKGKGPYIRQRSVDHVLGELKHAKASLPGLEVFSANDEVFGMKEEWLGEFCEQYSKHIGIRFHCDMHPAYITEGRVKRLKAIGQQTMSLGIQSSSDDVRRQRYQRRTSDEMLERSLEVLHRFGIEASFDFIFDDPLADDDELHDSIEWLSKRHRPLNVSLYSMQYLPKTVYTERLLKDGIIAEDQVDGISKKGLYEGRVTHKLEKRSRQQAVLLKLIELFNVSFFKRKGATGYSDIRVPTWLIRLLCAMSQKSGLKGTAAILIDVLHLLAIRMRRHASRFGFLRNLKRWGRRLGGLVRRGGVSGVSRHTRTAPHGPRPSDAEGRVPTADRMHSPAHLHGVHPAQPSPHLGQKGSLEGEVCQRATRGD
ncbi:MAG TPA: radical SAM protein [Phycisphaerae bacterium]|nr:radical SAM protein [Phycisphaerae bacterium]